RLGSLFYLDQTHATVGSNTEFLVITKVRHINTHVLGSLDDHSALGCFYFDAVSGEFYHVIVLCLPLLGHHTLLVLDVVCELVAEMLDKTTHGERSCITQATNRAPDDVAGNLVQHIEVFHATLAVLDAMHHTP